MSLRAKWSRMFIVIAVAPVGVLAPIALRVLFGRTLGQARTSMGKLVALWLALATAIIAVVAKADEPKVVPATAPDARLDVMRNRVEVQSKPAAPHAAVYRGNRVSTGEASAAEMTFDDDTRLSMGERSLVVLVGVTRAKGTQSTDVTLVHGSLRAHIADSAGHAPATMTVTSKWGDVKVGSGDAEVTVDEKKATRLAVHRGRSSLTSLKTTVRVDEGFGSKVEPGHVPTVPRPLPPAPEWKAAPPPLALVQNAPVDLSGDYGRGAGQGPEAAEWHVMVARDAAFRDVLVDSKVPATTTRLEIKQLGEGGYFARVSAIDGDHFEGAWSAPAPMAVVRIKTTDDANHYGIVETPRDLKCGIDAAPLTAAPVRYDRLAPHILNCALAGSRGTKGSDTVAKLAIAPEESGPLVLRGRWLTLDLAHHDGEAVLDLSDEKSQPISRPDAIIKATTPGATVMLAQASFDPGRYFVKTHWGDGITSIEYSLSLRGSSVTSNGIAIDEPPPPPPPIPHFLEIGVGAGGAMTGGPSALFGFHGDGHLGVRFGAGPGDVTVGIEGLVERYLRQSIHGSDIGLGIDSLSVIHTNYGVGLPLAYRLGAPSSRFAPFVGAIPQVLFQSSASTVPGAASVHGKASYFGLAPALGLELRAGPGAFVLEVAYRFAWSIETRYAGVTPKGATATLGYTFDL